MTAIHAKRPGGAGFTDLMIFRRRWWQHLLFWMLVIFVLLNIFKTSGSIEKIRPGLSCLVSVWLRSVSFFHSKINKRLIEV